MLINRVVYFLKQYLFWMLFLAFSRLLFLIYNFNFSIKVPVGQLLLSFVHGFSLDLSASGYLMFFMGLMLALTFGVKTKTLKKIARYYTLTFIVLFSIVSVVDMELYRNWGFRMDGTVFMYLKTPKEALASTKASLSIFLLAATAALIYFSFKLYKKYVERSLINFEKGNWTLVPVFLLIMGFTFIAIRGGVGIAPINTGSAYFSQYPFANHAAINVHWQIGNSLSGNQNEQVEKFMPDNEAKQLVDNLFQPAQNNDRFIDSKNPNIIIIILESFTARAIESLGGVPGVTPRLTELSHQGILYTNCYANGDRSDKGIVSVLSGYPAQPTTSIIKNSKKSEKLPSLNHELKKLGYNTSFYYGGDINFANMRSYFISCGFDKLITLNDFDPAFRNSKWGIHDHVVFDRLLSDCNAADTPFFKAMFTLSSHEPFDVPLTSKFAGKGEEAAFLNSVYYTDSCLGSFIDKAKTQTWWNNTLVLFVADHGSRWPGNISYSVPAKFRIPLLLVGGALQKSDTTISAYINQTDIPKLIGRQLDTTFSAFSFSKNVISDTSSFAFYAFNNGFGFLTPKANFVYDNASNQLIQQTDSAENSIPQGQAFLQVLLNDYNNK